MGRGPVEHSPNDQVTEKLANLWRQAETAAEAGQKGRARRYLRWILAVAPDDEEAWLWLARLAQSHQERLAYLCKAYSFHPDSVRVQVALRRARTEQLEASVGDLRTKPSVMRCLPDERQVVPQRPKDPDLDEKSLSMPAGGGTFLRRQRIRRLLSVVGQGLPLLLAFLLPLVVYVFTACRTVYNLDSAEFSAAVHVLGIVRATGYPLYLVLGKVFTSLLPVGDIAFRLNIMSAVAAAATVVLLYYLLLRLTRYRAAALAAALLFGFSYYFWAQAVVAEVYALHTLLVVGLLLLVLFWEETRSDWLLAAVGLLYGLSFGNHVSMILLAPGLVLFFLVTAGWKMLHPKSLLLVAGPFLLGLGIYGYVPLRYLAQPSFNYAGHYDALGNFVPLDMTRPQNVWWLITGKGFQGLMFDYSLAELVEEVQQAAYRLWGNFLGIGLVPGLLGIWAQGRRRLRYLVLFGLIFLANMVFFINYRVIDKETMFVTAYMIWAIWIGEGFAWLVNWVQERRTSTGWHLRDGLRLPDRFPAPAWAWGLSVLAVVALVVNWSLVDVRTDTRARDRAASALAEARPGAVIFGWWTSAPPMHYLQMVEEQRPDVLVINRFLIGADEMYSLINRSLAGQRPVYTMELDEGLIAAYQPVRAGPMFELTARELAGVGP